MEYFFVRAKENSENVTKYIEPTLVKLKLETSQSSTSIRVQFFVKTEVSIVDGKMVGFVDGGFRVVMSLLQ